MVGQEGTSDATDLNAAYMAAPSAWDATPNDAANLDYRGWMGEAGTRYHDEQVPPDRSAFWNRFLARYAPKSVLECGAGTGFNLRHIPQGVGVDVNPTAYNTCPRCIPGDIFDLPFKTSSFELVFTCGVLIHLQAMAPAMEEMARVSSRYVMMMEYADTEWVTIPYRDGLSLVRGPFGALYEDITADVLVDTGFLNRAEGFDRVTWWLFQKR